MRQQSFTDNNIEKFCKKIRKELFLDHMDHIIPCQKLTAAIESFNPKPKGADRHIENLITRRLKGRFADKDDTHAFHRGQKRIFSSGIVRIYASNPVPEHKVLKNGIRPYVRVNILRLSRLNYSGRNGMQPFTDVDGVRLVMVQIKEYYFSNYELKNAHKDNMTMDDITVN